MLSSIRFKLLLFLVFIVILTGQPVFSLQIDIPRGVFYYQPAASVFGSEAAWINPAGLGRYRNTSYQVMADYFDGNYLKSWGTVMNKEGIGIAYRKLNNPIGEDYREYIFASSVPVGGRVYLGGSYRYFKEGPGIYNKRHFWNIGLLGKEGNKISWGAVFSNLNRSKIDGVSSDIEQRYSLSYRPYGIKYSFSIDMLLSGGTKLLDAEYVYHFEVIPIPGLYLNGYLDSDKNFQLGVRTNLLQYFAGSKSLSDKKGNHLGTTTFFGTTDLRQPSIIKEKPRRLALAVSGHPHENPSRPLLGKRKTSFISILLKIYRAAEDPSISEMVLSLDRLSFGMGQAQEFREALTYFKNNGKKITCHLSYPNNISYYIGSVCSEILIPPVSQLNLVGLRAELTFYAGTMEKLGIDFELLRIGKYKTAPESFTRKAATEENKKQINRQLDDLYRQFVTGIAEGRSITEDSVRKIIDNGPFTSKEALEYGLVDGLSYRDEVDNNFLTKMPEISFQRYLTDTLMNDDWQVKPSIAVIVAKGDVTSDRTSSSLLGSDSDVTPSKMKKAFRRALQDKDVKGIVLRIDSPGGMALIGDEIYHLAQKAAEKKTVVVSMANIAASGGYYIAMSGRHIYANPATITGSIGIYGGKVNLSQLYQKINLGKELYTRGKFAGMFTSIRPFSDEEHEKYFSQLKAMYGHFISLVAENRNLTVDSVDNLAQGRVWTGKEAQVNGLIDELGGLKPSVDFAAGRLMLDDYQIKIYPEKRPFIILPGLSLFNTLASFISKEKHPVNSLEQLAISDNGEIFTRLPFDIEIK